MGELERVKQQNDDYSQQLIELNQQNQALNGFKEQFISLKAAYDQRNKISNMLNETEARLLRINNQNKELLQEIEELTIKN